MVEAAKMTAYCWRNLGLVKSTLAVDSTASLSLPTIQEAASAQPRAREERGSRDSDGSGDPGTLLGALSLLPSSQYFFTSPNSRLQSSFVLGEGVGVGVGVGVGSAAACPAKASAAACSPISEVATERKRYLGLPGISEASVLLYGLADRVGL